MRRITQRGRTDCAIAVAAALSGASYREARHVAAWVLGWPIVGERPGGTSADEMARLLMVLSNMGWWVSRRGVGRPVARLAEVRDAVPWAALVFSAPHRNRGHWIAIDRRGVVVDPEETTPPAALRCYARRRWSVYRTIRPVSVWD